MSSVNDLCEEFNRIRQEYFPRWLRGAKWTIEHYPGTAFCDRNNRRIQIGDKYNRNLTIVIIHEIVHAVTENGHGKRWLDRFHKVILQTRKNGEESLAAGLEDHLKNEVIPDNAHDVTAGELYEAVHYAALNYPSWSYEETVDAVAKSYGQTREVFESQYDVGRFRAEFERAGDVLRISSRRRQSSAGENRPS